MTVRRAEVLGELESEVGVMLRRIRRVIADRARAVHVDLAPSSYLMLTYVAENGPMRASEIAEQFDIDKGAISRQVALLERVGLVAREPDPHDGRAQRLVVTDEGRKRIEDARNGRRRLLREQLDQWPAEEVATLARLLGRYNQQMNAALGKE